MGDLVDATPGACTQFVQSLGLPELKAKRLLAALSGGAAHGEVLPCLKNLLGQDAGATTTLAHRIS